MSTGMERIAKKVPFYTESYKLGYGMNKTAAYRVCGFPGISRENRTGGGR
jgi:hypothetical protein